MESSFVELLPGDVIVMGRRSIGTLVPDIAIQRGAQTVAIVELFVKAQAGTDTWDERRTRAIPVAEVHAREILRHEDEWSAAEPLPAVRTLGVFEQTCESCRTWANQPRRERIEKLIVDVYWNDGRLAELTATLQRVRAGPELSAELRVEAREPTTKFKAQLIATWSSDVAMDEARLRQHARVAMKDWRSRLAPSPAFIEMVRWSERKSLRVSAWVNGRWRQVYGVEKYRRVDELVRTLRLPSPRKVFDASRGGHWLLAAEVDRLEEELRNHAEGRQR